MDKAEIAKPYKLGNPSGDVIVKLTNNEGRPEWFYSHSSVLINKSKYFADRLSPPKPNACVEIQCTVFNYDHHVNLLKLLYLDEDLVLDSLESVRSALGVLQVAVALHCEEIAQRCVEYLEANPWEDKEEEEIVKVALKIGAIAMPILARIQPVDLSAAKDVFVSAMRFATSNGGSYPDFGDELKISAQEQVEYMLGEDEDAPLVIAEEEVRSVVKTGLSNICSAFQNDLGSLLGESDPASDSVASKASRGVSDLEWMCNILPKMDLMKDFVLTWVEISADVLTVVDDKKLDNLFWGLKVKLIELTGKVLEAVGYGNVILPSASRVQLLKTWLPYIRKTKPALDSKSNEDAGFEHGMDDDLCQSIEGAIVSLILALPSNDQADILTDWMNAAEQVRYPDLSEAFEVWCYRTKSAKRRLVEGLELERVGNATVSL